MAPLSLLPFGGSFRLSLSHGQRHNGSSDLADVRLTTQFGSDRQMPLATTTAVTAWPIVITPVLGHDENTLLSGLVGW